jgi:hypothetical protein
VKRAHFVALLGLIALGAAASCDDETETDDTDTITTSVVVDPELFLGALECGALEGGPRSYLATVLRLPNEDDTVTEPEIVGQSGRVSCAVPLAFTNVETGERYAATIEVFDTPAGEPAGAPQWTTSCALDGDGAAEARTLQQVTIRGCDALTGPSGGETALLIDATAAAGALGCADDEGVLGDITITPTGPEDTTLPEVTRACGQGPMRYAGDFVEPGVTYTFRLEASDSALEQRWATTCEATAIEGFGVQASCGLMTSLGAAVFPIAELVEEATETCGESLTRARVALVAGPETLSPTLVGCDDDATIDGLPAGSYLGSLELLDGADVVAAFSCSGTVEPAASTPLVCVVED